MKRETCKDCQCHSLKPMLTSYTFSYWITLSLLAHNQVNMSHLRTIVNVSHLLYVSKSYLKLSVENCCQLHLCNSTLIIKLYSFYRALTSLTVIIVVIHVQKFLEERNQLTTNQPVFSK